MPVAARNGSPWRQAAIIVVIYLIVAGTYIALSDRIAEAVVTDIERLTTIQTVKGWAFVAATAAMLLVLIAHALTRRRSLESDAQASRERYRLLFDSISDATVVFEITGDGLPGRTIEANRAAAEQLGWSRDELLAKPITEVIAPGMRAQLPDLLRRLTVDGQLVAEGEHLHRDGRRIPVETHARLSTVDGRQVAMLIARDISERKRAEEELIRSERLAAVGVLASGLAHEFNNLHAAILGEIELTLLDRALGPEARQRLELAMATVERAGGLTRNLLALGRRGTGERSPCDLRALVAETAGMLRGQLRADGVLLDIAAGPAPIVLADRAQLGQVVMNLVINGWHALSGRPERRVTVRTGERDGEAFIAVEDTGCGIPPEQLPNLFIPFFTTKGARAAEGSAQAMHVGTGLGLSVSRAIVAAHGGRIEVASTPGRGSVFTVLLPAHVGGPAAAPPPAPVVPAARILVLDDEPLVREVVAAGLCAEGHQVVTSDDGEEALALHAQDPFAVVLVDLQMPKMSGAAFIARVRAGAAPPRIVAMTGRVEGDAPPEGVDEVLIKPFPLPELRRRIASALRPG